MAAIPPAKLGFAQNFSISVTVHLLVPEAKTVPVVRARRPSSFYSNLLVGAESSPDNGHPCISKVACGFQSYSQCIAVFLAAPHECGVNDV